MSDRLSILIWAPVVALLWAICFPFIVIGLPDAPPLLFAALRAALAGLMLLAVSSFEKPQTVCSAGLDLPDAIRSECSFPRLVAIGITFTGMGFGGMFLGAGAVSPGLATVLAGTQPLLAAVMAAIWLKEPLSRRVQLGMVIGFGGVVVIGWDSALLTKDGYAAGVAWIMLAALGTAAGNVLLKWHSGGAVHRPMAIQLLIGSVFLLALSTWQGETWHEIRWTLDFTMSLLVLSSLATAMMVVLWYRLLVDYTLNRLNVFSFLTPVFGLLIGRVFFAESLALSQIAGSSIILLGIALIQIPRSSSRR